MYRDSEWCNNAHDWEKMTKKQARKWIYEKLTLWHDPKGWMLRGAKSESAKNIGALMSRVPSRDFAKTLTELFFP